MRSLRTCRETCVTTSSGISAVRALFLFMHTGRPQLCFCMQNSCTSHQQHYYLAVARRTSIQCPCCWVRSGLLQNSLSEPGTESAGSYRDSIGRTNPVGWEASIASCAARVSAALSTCARHPTGWWQRLCFSALVLREPQQCCWVAVPARTPTGKPCSSSALAQTAAQRGTSGAQGRRRAQRDAFQCPQPRFSRNVPVCPEPWHRDGRHEAACAKGFWPLCHVVKINSELSVPVERYNI